MAPRRRATPNRSSLREEFDRNLPGIPGLVRRAPSRYGHGFAYFVGNREVAHFHGDERLDVRLTRAGIRGRVAEGGFDARVRTRGPSADWVTVRLENASDLALALALLEEAARANA